MIGTYISHYLILEKLDQGGMGVVFKAEDTRLQRFVVLKLLFENFAHDPQSRSRFLREARSISALNHPNICTIYDIGEHDGRIFLAMEWLDGQTLKAALQRGPLGLNQLVDIGIQVADALEAAHQEGIIHRDISPGNIFVTKHGRVKVLDFGLAIKIGLKKAATANADSTLLQSTINGADVTGHDAALGTASYMSPEQVLGKELDARTDLFSFGVALYEMATAKGPFHGDSKATIFLSILQDVPIPAREFNPNIPEELQNIIDKCLEKNRESRYQQAAAVRADLWKIKGLPKPIREEAPLNRVESDSRTITARPTEVTPKGKYWAFVTLAIMIVFVAVVFITASYQSKARKLTEKDTVILADFSNSTGDPIFDDTLMTALNVSLRQSPLFNVLPASRVQELMQLMELPKDSKVTSEIARELCQRANGKAYIEGTIAPLGTTYVIGLTAVNCQNGYTLAQQLNTSTSKEKVLDALGATALKLRRELGESLATIQKFDTPLSEATTSSLEALKQHSIGSKRQNGEGPGSGIPYRQKAIELDPNFALAYEALGLEYLALGETQRSEEYISKAFQLRQHASERERLAIIAAYYWNVTGELDKAERAYEEMIQNYPRLGAPYNNIGILYSQKGQYDEAVEWTRKAREIDPTGGAPYANLCSYELALQQFDQALQTVRDAQARKFEGLIYHQVLFGLAFLKGETSAMAEQQKWFASQPATATYGLALASDSEAFTGHLHKARELTNRSVESAINADNRQTAALGWENAALREAAFGDYREARRAVASGLKLSPANPSVRVEAALAFAISGDVAQSESIASDINKRFPSNTQVQSVWLPTIQAQIALDGKHPATALNDVRSALPPIEYGEVPFLNNISCLYSAYIRGQASLAAGDGNAAAAEFDKILDHSGMVWNCWTAALAHLGVARANALQARTSQGADADAARVRALAAYKDFLALWKEADPDIPILKEAQAEYAKLQ